MSYVRTEEKLLTIDHVSLKFGNNLVLRDVCAEITDVEVEGRTQGQVICFLGPSGIGKTQLSRIMAGLQTPTSGKVMLAGQELTQKGKVGMVPQNYPLFDYLTVAENLLLAGKQGGLSKDVVLKSMTMYGTALGLTEHANKYPCELSGGTRQRVAIVRQMLCADHYIVMDEPFSGLDPIMKKAAADLIVKLSQLHSKNTIIIVTHDIAQGCAVADTVWLMGYEKDGDKFLPGARLVEQYDLAALDLAWHPDIADDTRFQSFVRDINHRFHTLR